VFLGLHGINEGAVGGVGEVDKTKYWGETIQSVWINFAKHYSSNGRPDPAIVQAKSVSYPKLVVSLGDPRTWGNLGIIDGASDKAAGVLTAEIKYFRTKCGPDTALVLAGYSMGALAIDRAVRILGNSPDQSQRVALQSVVGVFLMGDPGWPPNPPLWTRSGQATTIGKGYTSKDDYENNELSHNEFQSICLGLADARVHYRGRTDPICMNPINSGMWIRDIPLHFLYIDTGITQRGADFLFPLAQSRSAR
jgi:hypothetical protein